MGGAYTRDARDGTASGGPKGPTARESREADARAVARRGCPKEAEALMKMRHQGRNAVVLGLGMTGLSMARHLARHGANVRVADTRADPPNRAALGIFAYVSGNAVFARSITPSSRSASSMRSARSISTSSDSSV